MGILLLLLASFNLLAILPQPARVNEPRLSLCVMFNKSASHITSSVF